MAASAVVFGLLGWVGAHALSSWLLDHAHVTGRAPDVWRLDEHADQVAILAAGLAIGSLAGLAAIRVRPRASKRAVRVSALLSTGAFVCTDAAERAVAGEYPVPPLMVLVLGLAVYAFIGACASLLWQCLVGAVRGALAFPEPRRSPALRRARAAACGRGVLARACPPRVSAGRSPPLAAGHLDLLPPHGLCGGVPAARATMP
ncbi:hypothetical protein [Glycomyces paridis]|uniref:Uncharacterized protein n=1 Tax=Glycomyces paridis TaxID=2126555 RepID=A0A4S8PAF6_9ACTN|nr:hypothetical protein [Glycomyces paridis]THV27250.1 hypothetical protein E9998_15435 [Glycomyces paridis]